MDVWGRKPIRLSRLKVQAILIQLSSEGDVPLSFKTICRKLQGFPLARLIAGWRFKVHHLDPSGCLCMVFRCGLGMKRCSSCWGIVSVALSWWVTEQCRRRIWRWGEGVLLDKVGSLLLSIPLWLEDLR